MPWTRFLSSSLMHILIKLNKMSANFKSISSGNQAKSAKSQNPNLGSIEEDFSALLCTEHNRIFEAYDMQRGT